VPEFSYTARVPFGADRKIDESREALETALGNAGGSGLTIQRGEAGSIVVAFRMPADDAQDALTRSETVLLVVFPPTPAFRHVISPVAPEI
jgi:hypothetical protein